MEGMKQCPTCECTDVPINAEICPFCGYSFGKMQKADSAGAQNLKKAEPAAAQSLKKAEPAAAQNLQKPGFPAKQNGRPVVESPVNKTEPVATVTDKGRSKGDKAPAALSSTDYKTYQKKEKKKHKFLKFLIVAAALAFVWFRFIRPSVEEDGDVRGEGMSDAYSASNESTEPESLMADLEDDWMYRSEETPELDSEEMPLDGAEDIPQFILPLSDQVYLTRADIEGLSAEELRIARNEIYARHGRIFKDEGLQAYFNSCDWYVGSVPADDFSDSVFNEYERANKDLIVSYEHELGVNGQ